MQLDSLGPSSTGDQLQKLIESPVSRFNHQSLGADTDFCMYVLAVCINSFK